MEKTKQSLKDRLLSYSLYFILLAILIITVVLEPKFVSFRNLTNILQMASTLSIIARWLLADPDILLLDEPTRGIDVGAKYEIYQLIINLAKEGKAVIFVSSEMPELLGVCDRIMVMSNGQQSGILDREDLSEEAIMRLSVKFV